MNKNYLEQCLEQYLEALKDSKSSEDFKSRMEYLNQMCNYPSFEQVFIATHGGAL